MSWGRGRGRGSFGGGFGRDWAKQEPFVIFPEIALPDPKLICKEPELVANYFKFQKFWKNSVYHLGDGVKKQENESLDIERYSDSLKPKNDKSNKKGSFYDYLILRPDNFPKDLLGDTRRERPVKRAKWSQDDKDLLKLDVFEKLEEKYKAEGKEEKDGEEDEEEVGEDEGEESDDDNDDYMQNQDFDDDDDDYNQEDDGGNEDVY